ncbi:MAG TPA: hypothetical protein VKY92_06665 [Verrucomicrobiae bacterium]|nr:hypothetical protein [Verrucomicrobiae bacterium]
MKTTKKTEPDAAANSAEFINTDALLERIPVSKRTLGTWREDGKIPFVKLNKRVIYHWPSVQQALLRQQRGL